MVAYVPLKQRQERFITVYVFCPRKDDNISYLISSSDWHVLAFQYVDEGIQVSATVYATMFDTETGRLRGSHKTIPQIERDCKELIGTGFNRELPNLTSRLYPVLFAKLRHAGFIDKAVLVKHHDQERTLYCLARHSVRILGEQKVA